MILLPRASTPHDRLWHSTKAFTLVEIAIVMTVIGLIVGAVIGGREVLRSAELRAVVGEAQRYETAIHAFREKYQALPGDMRGATDVWGFRGTTASPGCASNSGVTTVSTNGTCDGNGNGIIDYGGAANTTSEVFQAWRQLALAELIEGQYSGNAGNAGPYNYNFGENSPRTKIANAGWMISFINLSGGGGYTFDYDYRSWLGVGGHVDDTDNTWADNGIFTNSEAWSLDSKLDDAMPGTGSVHGMGIGYGCTTASPTPPMDRTAKYDLRSQRANACALLFQY